MLTDKTITLRDTKVEELAEDSVIEPFRESL